MAQDELFVPKTLILTSELEALRRQAALNVSHQPSGNEQEGFGDKEFGTEDSDFVPSAAKELLGKTGKPEENSVNPVHVPVAEGSLLPAEGLVAEESEEEGPEIQGNHKIEAFTCNL